MESKVFDAQAPGPGEQSYLIKFRCIECGAGKTRREKERLCGSILLFCFSCCRDTVFDPLPVYKQDWWAERRNQDVTVKSDQELKDELWLVAERLYAINAELEKRREGK